MAAISADKVAVYDRQLRLWGVQAQQRLLNAKVLIWGLEGSNVEACKNLILAGISLTLRDHRNVAEADVAFNYFLRSEDLGKNRAECASKRVQEMNPLCAVSSLTTALEAGSDTEQIKAAVDGFDIVVLGLGVLDFDFDRAAAIDSACREAGCGFMLTLAAGELAFFFSDLKEHVMQERSSAQGAEPSATAAPQEAETFTFPALSEWLTSTPASLVEKKVDESFQLIALFANFVRNGGKAVPAAAGEFEVYCRDTAKCLPKIDGIPGGVNQAFGFFFVEPLMHVASVLGGLLAQEVIKGITKRDPPMVNSVCFNAHSCAALVERLPLAPPAEPKKRKAEETDVADILD
jgi:ubiquitin-like 1-activating enzyme E1 A